MLEGRAAIVTGAGNGIGHGIATEFLRQGAAVTAVDIDSGGLEQLRAASTGERLETVTADVSDESAVRRAVDGAKARFGPAAILVNCAGIRGAGRRVGELGLADWNKRLAVNLTSAFLFSSAVVDGMKERRWGRIVNISSQLALRGAAMRADYCASKAGLNGFTRALARELAPFGVTVNAVAPGPTETKMLGANSMEALDALKAEIPLGRFATVAEIVPTVVLLASDAGAYYTGQVLNISGGHVMAE